VVSDRITNTKGLVEARDPRRAARYATARGDADVVDTSSRTQFHLHIVI
jgi:hypothetical protein